jgi:uncharacterized protein (TIGR02996 family)
VSVGARVGEYILLRSDHRARCFEYWIAAPVAGGREVLLALLLPALFGDDLVVMHLGESLPVRREWRHPQIPALLEWFECEHPSGAPTMAVVFELFSGVSCSDLLRNRGALPPPIAACIVEQIARAIHDSNGWEHGAARIIDGLRAISVDRDGTAYLLAITVPGIDHRISLTQTGVVRGRFAYLSPESVMGERLVQQSAVFTLGVVLYQLIAGARPFDRESDLETLHAIRTSSHAPLSTLVEVPEELEQIVERSLAREPRSRFDDAGALARALSAVASTAEELSAFVHRPEPVAPDAGFDREDTKPGAPVEDAELELLRRIRAEPDAADPYLVYADLLQSRGDPRGELIVLHHRGGRDPALERQMLGRLSERIDRADRTRLIAHFPASGHWFGDLSYGPLSVEWRLGFLSSLRIAVSNPDEPEAELLELLERHPSARFLRHLVIGPREGSLDLDRVYAKLSWVRFRLLSLYVGDLAADPPASWHRNVDAICPAFPRLRKLTLRGANIRIERLAFPELRELSIHTREVSRELRRAIDESVLPKLEKLDLTPG